MNSTGDALAQLESSLSATNVLSASYRGTITAYANRIAEAAHTAGVKLGKEQGERTAEQKLRSTKYTVYRYTGSGRNSESFQLVDTYEDHDINSAVHAYIGDYLDIEHVGTRIVFIETFSGKIVRSFLVYRKHPQQLPEKGLYRIEVQ